MSIQTEAMVFPVVMHIYESWTIKKAEQRRTDAFDLWCWRTLEYPLDCKETKPVNPKGNQPWDWCWSWSSNTLATWCEELTYWKRPWCWERLKAGAERDGRGWDGWMTSLTSWTWVWTSSWSWLWTQKPGVLQSMGVSKSQTQLSDWTELNYKN